MAAANNRGATRGDVGGPYGKEKHINVNARLLPLNNCCFTIGENGNMRYHKVRLP